MGKGGDFIQEECNKLIKSFLLPGMSSAKIWRGISRKATILKELKESACETTSGKKLGYKQHFTR